VARAALSRRVGGI
jgi:hypothetical protein